MSVRRTGTSHVLSWLTDLSVRHRPAGGPFVQGRHPPPHRTLADPHRLREPPGPHLAIDPTARHAETLFPPPRGAAVPAPLPHPSPFPPPSEFPFHAAFVPSTSWAPHDRRTIHLGVLSRLGADDDEGDLPGSRDGLRLSGWSLPGSRRGCEQDGGRVRAKSSMRRDRKNQFYGLSTKSSRRRY